MCVTRVTSKLLNYSNLVPVFYMLCCLCFRFPIGRIHSQLGHLARSSTMPLLLRPRLELPSLRRRSRMRSLVNLANSSWLVRLRAGSSSIICKGRRTCHSTVPLEILATPCNLYQGLASTTLLGATSSNQSCMSSRWHTAIVREVRHRHPSCWRQEKPQFARSTNPWFWVAHSFSFFLAAPSFACKGHLE